MIKTMNYCLLQSGVDSCLYSVIKKYIISVPSNCIYMWLKAYIFWLINFFTVKSGQLVILRKGLY